MTERGEGKSDCENSGVGWRDCLLINQHLSIQVFNASQAYE